MIRKVSYALALALVPLLACQEQISSPAADGPDSDVALKKGGKPGGGRNEVLSFRLVSSGWLHTCAVTETDAAYCWGRNNWFQLGGGSKGAGARPYRNSPTPVAGGLSIVAVAAGGSHNCALTPAGEAYCWGANSAGELGDGTGATSSEPVAVAGGLTFGVLSHSCGLTLSGVPHCWGSNYTGQVGDGTQTDRFSPVPVAGGHVFTSIDAGTCAVRADGTAYCWGDNRNGQLGAPSPERSTVPLAVSGGLTFAQVSRGGDHACGVTTDGDAYCWGFNREGQLGTPTTELCGDPPNPQPCSRVPLKVTGGLKFASISVNGGSIGGHTCGVTVTGEVYCWGFNGFSQLGAATSETCVGHLDLDAPCSTVPIRVSTSQTFTSVSAGSFHTCGMGTDGILYCWGDNEFGQVGTRTSETCQWGINEERRCSTTPIRVAKQG